MRYTIHTKWEGSNGTYVAVYNTFAEVLAYIQAVCDVNCETAGLAIKIIDHEKKEDVYNGPLNPVVFAGLKYNYEKGLILMDDIKGKLITTLTSAMQPDVDKWVASDDNHVATFDLKPIGAIWSFHDLGVTPTDHNTISVIQEGAYFRIKYNAATKYIITKHGDVFLIDYNRGSRIVTDSAISKALYTTFFHPESTDCIFTNEIFKTIGDWVKTHMTDANWQTNGIEFAIINNESRRSFIDIKSAANNAKARCVRINDSILAIWSGNEWISNDSLIGNVCARGLSIHEVGCLRDVIVNIKPEQKPSDSKLFEEYLANLSPEDANKNIMDDLISHGNTTTQKPDSTDEQYIYQKHYLKLIYIKWLHLIHLLKSSNAKSFDELFEQLESIKHVVVPPSMIGIDPLTDDSDMYKRIIDGLKSHFNATGQPIITAIQKPDRNRQMMHRIKPIICKWLKDIVYSAGPFSSFEEVSEPTTSLKYSFILHGDRDANISMEIPTGFIGVIFISHDGVRIMRIGPDDVVCLLPLYNIDPDIQINRLHNMLYEVLNIKQKRSKIDEIIKCITFFIRTCYPDIQYSICGKHINIIKRSAAADAPVGSIKLGFSYKPGYQLAIWQDNNYDHPLIEFDDNWKPVLDSQDGFARKMYSWLSVNFGCEEENPMVISDSLAESLCRSDKVKSLCRSDKVIPIRFTPNHFSRTTHNFKSWYPTCLLGEMLPRKMIAEAVNLKTMPEGADGYMNIVMEIVKERNNMIKIPGIKNVLFNDTKQTTTVLFDDGTITMSKTMDGETYDREVGFAMCIMKKMYGNRTRFQKEIKKWTSICENANKKIADKVAKKQWIKTRRLNHEKRD